MTVSNKDPPSAPKKSTSTSSPPYHDDNHHHTRDWVVEKGLYNYPTTCKEPERLSDKMWDMVSSTEFACKVILFNHPNAMKSFDHTINQK